MSQTESSQCRKLHEKFDKNVQTFHSMSARLTELEADGTEGLGESNVAHLPA